MEEGRQGKRDPGDQNGSKCQGESGQVLQDCREPTGSSLALRASDHHSRLRMSIWPSHSWLCLFAFRIKATPAILKPGLQMLASAGFSNLTASTRDLFDLMSTSSQKALVDAPKSLDCEVFKNTYYVSMSSITSVPGLSLGMLDM